MTKVYHVDVLLVATAYIVADSEQEAAILANEAFGDGREGGHEASVSDSTMFGDVPVSGAPFGALVEGDEYVTLSPALTFYGSATGAIAGRPFTATDPAEAWDSEEDGEG